MRVMLSAAVVIAAAVLASTIAELRSSRHAPVIATRFRRRQMCQRPFGDVFACATAFRIATLLSDFIDWR